MLKKSSIKVVKVTVSLPDNPKISEIAEKKRLATLLQIAREFISAFSYQNGRAYAIDHEQHEIWKNIVIQEVRNKRIFKVVNYYTLPFFLHFFFEKDNMQVLKCIWSVEYACHDPNLIQQRQIIKTLIPIAEKSGINKIIFKISSSDELNLFSGKSSLFNPLKN